MRKKNKRHGARNSTSLVDFSWLRGGLVSLSGLLLLVLIVYFLHLSWSWFRDPKTLPFKTLQVVTQSHYIDNTVLQRLVQSHLMGGFFSFNEEAVRTALLTNPWVKSVGIRRVFPSTLVVRVDEYQPIAFWQDRWILTQSGILILADQATQLHLPHFSGPSDAIEDVQTSFKTFSQLLAPLHFSIASLTLSDRRSWQLQLSNGLDIVLGREHIEQRFRRFVSAYPEIIARHGGVMHRVDLRYTNGMAVSWSRVMQH